MPFEKGKVPKGAKPFKEGESGNPNGRPKKLPKLDEMLADVMGEEQNGMTAAIAILKKLRQKAIAGDTKSAEILLDRSYGKVGLKSENPIEELMRKPTWFEHDFDK